MVALLLAAAVLAAVHHAEVVAHRVGEPFGSLVLAVAVTVIEVALILTLMVSGGKDTSVLARDTVFAAVMITCNGIVGLCLLAGAVKFGTTHFNAEGTGAALATVITLADPLPGAAQLHHHHSRARSSPGSQLAFAAVASLAALRDVRGDPDGAAPRLLPAGHLRGELVAEDEHAARPSDRRALLSLGMLVISLVAVVGLAKVESTPIEDAVTPAGSPPGGRGRDHRPAGAAARVDRGRNAARRGRTQISLNLALAPRWPASA